MKVAPKEKPWVQYVREGNLQKAFELYSEVTGGFSLLHNRFGLWLTRVFYYVVIWPLAKFLPFDFSDTATDLSVPFILFWKDLNAVGPELIKIILVHLIKERKFPGRALTWLGHWHSFHGNNRISLGILRLIHQRMRAAGSNATIRTKGEIYSLLANFFFVRAKYSQADFLHEKSHHLLVEAKDRFFQMYNLGQWVRVSAQTLDLEHLKRILSLFDNLDMNRPDERYGLRMLSHVAYLHHKNGNNQLADVFFHSAERIYLTSGSQLDKSLFKLTEAIILRERGELDAALKQVQTAKAHLAKYGAYVYFERILNELEALLKLETRASMASKIIILRQPLEMPISKAPQQIQPQNEEEKNWYKKFFVESLSLYDSFNEMSIDELCTTLARQCGAENVSHSPVEPGQLKNIHILDDKEHSQFSFSIYHQGNNYFLKLRVPFVNWRNPEILASIRSVCLSLQALGNKNEEIDRKKKWDQIKQQNLLAAQVAHDIRSPLAALDVAAHDLSQLSEAQRSLIRSAVGRIHDIANNLLDNRIRESKELNQTNLEEKESSALPALIGNLVNSLITEKRTLYRSKINVRIESQTDIPSYGAFVKVEPSYFKRVLSNLIDNSVEALNENGGEVAVLLSTENDYVILKVRDTGKGIPAEILPKLMKEGGTYGKANGHGLGLHFAKKQIEKWNGTIEIRSEWGRGTEVEVKIPRATPPQWFVQGIKLENYQNVVVLDDDPSVHQVWMGRLEKVSAARGASASALRVRNLSTPEQLNQWHQENKQQVVNTLFLMDYELLGHRKTGLDLIENLNIQKNSILVTSRYEDEMIVKRCQKLGLSLLPKALAGFIPIN